MFLNEGVDLMFAFDFLFLFFFSENHLKINSPTACDGMSGPSYCSQLNVWAVGIHGECFPDKFGIPIGSHGYTHFMLQVNNFV